MSHIDINEELNQKILQSDLSIKEIARKSGIHANTISIWLNNKGQPTLANAQYVLQALGYDIQIVKKVDYGGKQSNSL